MPCPQVWTYHNQVALVLSVTDTHEVHNQQLANHLVAQLGLRPGLPAALQPPLAPQEQVLLQQPALRPGVAGALSVPQVMNHQPNPYKLQRLQVRPRSYCFCAGRLPSHSSSLEVNIPMAGT